MFSDVEIRPHRAESIGSSSSSCRDHPLELDSPLIESYLELSIHPLGHDAGREHTEYLGIRRRTQEIEPCLAIAICRPRKIIECTGSARSMSSYRPIEAIGPLTGLYAFFGGASLSLSMSSAACLLVSVSIVLPGKYLAIPAASVSAVNPFSPARRKINAI